MILRPLILLALLALSACASIPPLADGARYVAMGSSFAAGPGLSPAYPNGLSGCQQSDDSYAAQLARLRHLTLVNVGCGGATTANVLTTAQNGHPPQIEAVTADTALVTVTIGGNDVAYIGDLGAWACRAAANPLALCAAPASLDREAEFKALPARMAQIAAEVRRRAPRARLVFVDYLTLIPPAGSECPGLGLSPGDAAKARDIAQRLAAITAATAKTAKADLITASVMSRDHPVCSAQPWANGYRIEEAMRADGSAAFHPRRAGMTAIAGGAG